MKSELKEVVDVLKKGNTFQYPLESLKDGYLATLEHRLEEYRNRIDNIPMNNSLIQSARQIRSDQNSLSFVEDMGDQVIDIIKLYLAGNAEEAYRRFSSLLDSNRNYIDNLIIRYEENQETLYRVRWSEKEITLKEDIFHIPFDKRHLIDTQRYSIAGVPCLYFGNTIYACWIEMGKPDLNKLFISKFKNTEKVNVLDFAVTFDTFIKVPTIQDQYPEEYTKEKIESFLLLYPLIMACSFKKQTENAKFNIEYIIPNMMLQWISNNKDYIDGIRYFSTKMKHERYDSIGINIVFPPKEDKDSMKGFCPKLKRTFKFTAPVSWSMINTFPLKDVNMHYPQKVRENEKILQSTEEVISSHYKMTRFYQVEQNIDNYFESLTLDDKQRPKKFTIDDWYKEESFDNLEKLTNVNGETINGE